MTAVTDPGAILAIVPARKGSKGVVGKNLRPVGGRPLIAHTLDAIVDADVADRLVISTDDERIAHWAHLHGIEVVDRAAELADDAATIADVAASVADDLDWTGTVAVFQPTSPLRGGDSIRRAAAEFAAGDVTSMASAVREPHLYWFDQHDDLASATPLFAQRVNRQFGHHRVLRETGSIQFVRADFLRRERLMVAPDHRLFEVDPGEALDIDTFGDLLEARRAFEQATIVFRVRANERVGTGHLHHCIQLAEELGEHELRFLLVDGDPFAAAMLDERGYVHQPETDLGRQLDQYSSASRRVLVNDVLDTQPPEVIAAKARGWIVVNVEDLGPGARYADWVVNALYGSSDLPAEQVASGPAYATLRSEFLDLPPRQVRSRPERVLVTFGGSDPSRLTERFAPAIADAFDGEVVVITGPGRAAPDLPSGCVVRRGVSSMAEEMRAADLVVTSAGRTVYEAAATGTPVVVVAQNAREASHVHLGYDSGVVFLGIGTLVETTHLVGTVERLLADHPLRVELADTLLASIDGRGVDRITSRIRALLRGA